MSLTCPLRPKEIFLVHIAWYDERKRCDIIPAMADTHVRKKPQFPANVDSSVVIADVPVKIAFMHGDIMLGEFEDVIALAFTQKTEKGRQVAKRLSILTVLDGLSTENALYTIAGEEVKKRTADFI